MTDTQTLNAILDAYINWQATIGEIPSASDCDGMKVDEYDAMMNYFKKEIAKLEHQFFEVMDEAVERALANSTIDEDEDVPIEELLK